MVRIIIFKDKAPNGNIPPPISLLLETNNMTSAMNFDFMPRFTFLRDVSVTLSGDNNLPQDRTLTVDPIVMQFLYR